jgi:hypothetical protein
MASAKSQFYCTKFFVGLIQRGSLPMMKPNDKFGMHWHCLFDFLRKIVGSVSFILQKCVPNSGSYVEI